MSDNPQSDGPGLTLLGKLISILLIGGLFFGAYVLLSKGAPQTSGEENPPAPPKPATPEDPQPRQDLPPGQTVTVGIAYGTEKKLWMQWALEEFGKTDAGRRVKIELIPM
ncbi:MAG: hypothetical protein KIS92_25005, partial [Planctomycetota bacterium]|nr:hypothetical protein [Planctomycetota bacterium]